MDEDTIAELKRLLCAHANSVRCLATLHKMRVANDNARSNGEEDRYGADDFADIEKEASRHAEELAR